MTRPKWEVVLLDLSTLGTISTQQRGNWNWGKLSRIPCFSIWICWSVRQKIQMDYGNVNLSLMWKGQYMDSILRKDSSALYLT